MDMHALYEQFYKTELDYLLHKNCLGYKNSRKALQWKLEYLSAELKFSETVDKDSRYVFFSPYKMLLGL